MRFDLPYLRKRLKVATYFAGCASIRHQCAGHLCDSLEMRFGGINVTRNEHSVPKDDVAD
jgi:hypothetical protein